MNTTHRQYKIIRILENQFVYNYNICKECASIIFKSIRGHTWFNFTITPPEQLSFLLCLTLSNYTVLSTNTSIITNAHLILQDLVSFSVKDGKSLSILDTECLLWIPLLYHCHGLSWAQASMMPERGFSSAISTVCSECRHSSWRSLRKHWENDWGKQERKASELWLHVIKASYFTWVI